MSTGNCNILSVRTMQEIACHMLGNTKSGDPTKICRIEESNFQAIRGLCEQFMHHIKFSLVYGATFYLAEFLSLLVIHKIIVGLAIDALNSNKQGLTNGMNECCQVLCH